MNAVAEEGAEWVAGKHWLQARIAVTGSVADLAARVSEVIEASSGGWQAELSMRYMIEFAARHRPPEQVTDLLREFTLRFGTATVLEVACERPPTELAAIAAALPDPTEFLRTVAARRRPPDLAAMLAEMDGTTPLLRQASGDLCSSLPTTATAQVIVQLRGMNAAEPLACMLNVLPWRSSATALGQVLVQLDDLGDTESVNEGIARVLAWRDDGSPARGSQNVDAADRVAAVVNAFRKHGKHALADCAVTGAEQEFANLGQRHLLCALIIAFRELRMHDDASRIADAIEESPDGDSIETVLRFCANNKEYAGALLQVFLKKPRPAAVATLARSPSLGPLRETIFGAVAEWEYRHLKKVAEDLSGRTNILADEFRAVVAGTAAARPDGADIGDIVGWLLADWATDQGRQQACQVIADLMTRREPGKLVDVICKLRAFEVRAGAVRGWWYGPRGKTVRDEAERHLSEHYRIEEMTRLIDAAADRCLPAVHRMSAYWLTRRGRSDREVVQLVTALVDAECTYEELKDSIEWLADNNLQRPDGSDPLGALTTAADAALQKNRDDTILMGLRNDWVRVKHSMRLRRIHRPDPDRAHG